MSGIQNILLGTGSGVAAAVDPFFYSVTSLLHGDGTNGAQNNTFLDSSTNNFTITRNGNTTQGSFSPFSQTGWGWYFDGSGDYLSVADNAALDLGTGDFTIECWVYPITGISNVDGLIGKRNQGTFNSGDWRIAYISASTSFGIACGQDNVDRTTPSINLNAWNHVAFVRSSGTLSCYANGLRNANLAWAHNLDNAEELFIGLNVATFDLPGYISNVRIVKGTAVYSGATYTVPTAPLTAISGTSLLTCQANRFLDASSNAFAITRNGDVSVQPFSPFNPTTAYSTSAVGGSGYFDGSGDYLSVARDNVFLPGANTDFTIEAWVYLTATPGATDAQILGFGEYGLNSDYVFAINSSRQLFFYFSSSNTSCANTTTLVPLNAWTYVAVSRSGTGSNNLKVFVNGNAASFSVNSTLVGTGGNNLTIGADANGDESNLTGYITNIRFINGTGYTSLTVPTSPLTAITNTQLLTNFTNAGIFDNAAVADYETVGNAQISTSVKKYGTGSMSFDGTGDYLTIPYNQFINFGTGDFTIEGWFYLNSFANQYYVLGGTWTTGTSDEWLIQIENNGSLRFLTTANTSFFATGLIKTGTWYHFAASRNAGVIKAYINGNVFATIANTNSIGSTSKVLNIGQQPGGTWPWNGYVDDWRISKGIGRYPYNFTPPTAEFPNIGGTVTLTADPYFYYTTLLLPGNGTNGAQNNTFLDSSTNAFSITRNGNTTQGTFSPFSQTGWGNYFDGSGDYLETPSNAAFTLGSSGDFTVECWVYATATPGNYAPFMTTWSDANTGYPNRWFLGVHDSKIKWYNDAGGSAIADSSNIQLNTWLHVAVARSGSTITLYINGTAIGTQTTSQSYTTQGTVKLGYSGTGGNYFSGYISNARVVKGTAVYTANFTPSTTPLTAITNTSLLTCQSNRFVDNSSNAFAITRNGDVSVQAFSPFNPTAAWSAATYGGSGYFDGSGDYLTVPDNAAFDFGSGDFTISAWVYPQGAGAVIDQGGGGASSNRSFEIYMSSASSISNAYISSDGTYQAGYNLTGTTVPNAWNFIEFTRASGTLRLFVNGVQQSSVSANVTIFNSTATVAIGNTSENAVNPFTGYISSVRVLKGTGSATSTVPTAPLTAITNTQLLTNFTNAGIYDATSKNDLETVGNAQISTTQSKFGGSSMYFDGTGDYLVPNVATSDLYAFGSGDWTVEMWVYSATNQSAMLLDWRPTSTSGAYITWYLGTGVPVLFVNAADRIIGGSAIPTNAWVHLAICRFSGSTKMFVNGIQSGSTYSDSNVYLNSANRPLIASNGFTIGGSPSYFTGYIDDLRITKGIARYTSNFTPPTTAFLTL